MKVTMLIECKCGNSNKYDLKRTENPVWDYLEITSSINDEHFTSKELQEGIEITCTVCKRRQEIL